MPSVQQKSSLSSFIRDNIEPILKEWDTFARSLPTAGAMSMDAMRDHAREILVAIAKDLATPQSSREQNAKALGKTDAVAGSPADRTAAQEHGAGRAEHGFNVGQMVSEFRALRASVVRLWTRTLHAADETDFEDLTRFNEAIDQAIAESITRFAQDIGESKERFLAILAHDLRTPLGSIITSSTFMLESGELEEPNRTLIERIGTSARRMNQMVVDLLDFTRTRFGDSIPIVRVATDVRKIVHDVIGEVAASHPKTRIRLETSGDLHGKWDADRLTQAFTNLIGNAAQHGADTSPIIVVARGLDREVEIAVQNEGPVIPEGDLGHLFRPMKQAKTNTPRDRRHLGLGLYIVDKIADAHGGSIEVSSSKAEGTRFTFHLPRDV